MYESFYGLSEPAFDLTPNPRFLLLTDWHREALSNLQYGLSARKGITLLTGEAGTGKTTLVRTALEGLHRQQARGIYVNNPTLTRSEFVETLARDLGLSQAAYVSKSTFLAELTQHLTTVQERGSVTALIVDEAQSLSDELLEEIRLLTNVETNEQKLLPLVLAGQPELSERLEGTALRQLKQRVALRCELAPLTLHETAAYISTRISVAGGDSAKLFTREAVLLIHERSRGIPRTINVLCDNALVSGFAAGQRPVGTRIVLEVCRDFVLGGPSAREAGGPLLGTASTVDIVHSAAEAGVEVSNVEHGANRTMFGDLFKRRRDAS